MDIISEEKIKSGRNFNFIGKKIICMEEIDSTNNEAKRNSHYDDGTVFVAERQSNGRGRRGREWFSSSDGIWTSILLKPRIESKKLPVITLVAGLAVCKVLKKRGLNAQIKWPNDVVINKKKVCGILSEFVWEKDEPCVILGLGINVNIKDFPNELEVVATSVYMESGKAMDKAELLGEILKEFEEEYEFFLKQGFLLLMEEYKKNCASIGKMVKVILPDIEYEAFCEDINSDGELVVKRGEEKIILNSGEVSVRGIYGYI